jgi:hypothetical protein
VQEKEWRVKGRCQTGHIEKVSRRIYYRLLEDHDPPECLFIIFNSTFDSYTSHIHWVVWGIGTPKDRDEVKRREV